MVIDVDRRQRANSTPASVIALIRPGMVYSLASMSTGRPSSRRVDEVTGPIEAKRRSSDGLDFRGLGRHVFFPSRATKFLTVDELVNVMTWGLRFGFFKITRSLVREDCGITVS